MGTASHHWMRMSRQSHQPTWLWITVFQGCYYRFLSTREINAIYCVQILRKPSILQGTTDKMAYNPREWM